MSTLAAICQIVIALGIANVWLLRHDQPTRWRPEGTANMAEEFRRYGLPDWMRLLVGGAKLVFAALLIAGIWLPPLAVIGGLGMALLMAAAMLAHIKVGDPLSKALPAFTLLVLAVLVSFANSV